MDTSPELVNPTGKFKIGSVEAELALNYAGADGGRGQPDITLHLPANYWDSSETNKLRPQHLTGWWWCWCFKYFLHIFKFLFKYSTLLGQPSSSSSSSCLFYRITLTNIYNQTSDEAGPEVSMRNTRSPHSQVRNFEIFTFRSAQLRSSNLV